MTVVSQELRLTELRRLGMSEPLIQLSAGNCIHKVFRDLCLGPPFYVYHRAGVPSGPPLVPLWDRGDQVAGVRENQSGLEFIEFSIEAPQDFRRLAGSEQGFWVTRFDVLYERDVSLQDLHDAANLVRFRFFDKYLACREVAEGRMQSFKEHQSWLRHVVQSVDREAAG